MIVKKTNSVLAVLYAVRKAIFGEQCEGYSRSEEALKLSFYGFGACELMEPGGWV
jgi:hypothetical protein